MREEVRIAANFLCSLHLFARLVTFPLCAMARHAAISKQAFMQTLDSVVAVVMCERNECFPLDGRLIPNLVARHLL